MGTYRFILAILVALSHMHVYFGQGTGYRHNQGVVAVISFLLLSGMMMTALIGKYYSDRADVADFYRDRAARLLPQYLFFYALTVVGYQTLHYQADLLVGLRLPGWLLNFLIVPLGVYKHWPLIGVATARPMPQVWSLGLEASFYVLIPWILIDRRRMLAPLVALSLLVAALAYIGSINTYLYGYYLLPGTLFIFLIGASFTVDTGTPVGRRLRMMRWGAVVLSMALWGGTLVDHHLYRKFSREVYAGLALGIVVLGILRHCPSAWWDRLLGNLSYGVFLDHLLALWTYRRLTGVDRPGAMDLALILLFATALAGVGYFLVERPAVRWRHHLRARHLARALPDADPLA